VSPIRIHERTQTVQRAGIEMAIACSEIWQKHDLTTAEYVHCLAQLPAQTTKYLLREERHPDDPEKRADEA
jgi:hypothetical protein